jgi:hypothetical protein
MNNTIGSRYPAWELLINRRSTLQRSQPTTPQSRKGERLSPSDRRTDPPASPPPSRAAFAFFVAACDRSKLCHSTAADSRTARFRRPLLAIQQLNGLLLPTTPDSAVTAYRAYYRAEKRGHWRKVTSRNRASDQVWVPAKWTKRDPPEWF